MRLYEHRSERPLSRREFLGRLARHGGYAAMLAAISIIIGMSGYHWIAGQSWVDSFLNASMLLGGMGPVGELSTTPGKIFAGVFALYASSIGCCTGFTGKTKTIPVDAVA